MSEWSSFTWPPGGFSDFKVPDNRGPSPSGTSSTSTTTEPCRLTIATLPLVLIFAGQRYIIGGISLTASRAKPGPRLLEEVGYSSDLFLFS